MDNIKNMSKLEQATRFNRADFIKLGLAILFVLAAAAVALYSASAFGAEGDSRMSGLSVLIVATMVGGYMAMNIGANDVANNVGPAVGSKALTMGGAILIAAVCEASGAIIAGGDVVDTIRSGIIDSSVEVLQDKTTFINLMLSALISSAVWLHLATVLGAPVSTTHSVVGGILGAGIMAGGFGIVQWTKMMEIVGSWIISPVLGGLIAASFLFVVKRTITYKEDQLKAAQTVVPILLFLMTFAFCMYMIDKGFKDIFSLPLPVSLGISIVIGLIVYFVCRPLIIAASAKLENNKESVGKFFTIPLIFAAALLSFAHGTNDVANAIGPLAAINDLVVHSDDFAQAASVPLWIMIVGGFGISLGLALYGPKLIRTVGSEITELDQIRAFCVAMSAAVTVLVASALGLPISSTHVAVGAVFGVGFLREGIKRHYFQIEQTIIEAHKESGEDTTAINQFLETFRKAPMAKKQLLLKAIKQRREAEEALAAAGVAIDSEGKMKMVEKTQTDNALPFLSKKEQKKLKQAYKEELVKRSAFNKIIATWIITVPVAAVLSGTIYLVINWFGISY